MELQYKVKSISVFGDPSEGENLGNIWPRDWPYGLQQKVRHVCAEGDPVSSLEILNRNESLADDRSLCIDLRRYCHVLLQPPHLHPSCVH
jgi:hypothetical protein